MATAAVMASSEQEADGEEAGLWPLPPACVSTPGLLGLRPLLN